MSAVHYLRRGVHGFRVVGRWFDVGAMADPGQGIAHWSVSRDFGTVPMLYSDGEVGHQGYRCSYATLTELAPNSPRDVVTFQIGYSDVDARGDRGVAIHGTIVRPVSRNGFVVAYRGGARFDEHYRRHPDGYRLAERSTRLPYC